MSPATFADLGNLENVLDFHLQRHSVLVSNVANGDTPGYVAQDLSFESALADAGMAATHGGHIGAGERPEFAVEAQPGIAHTDGNGVELEKAMSQVTANRLRYETGIELARRQVAMLRYAAADGSGA